MNLMVILVPFLLITAVFSRLAILELNLPGSSTEPVDPEDQTFQLEVIVRKQASGQIEQTLRCRRGRLSVCHVGSIVRASGEGRKAK